MHRYNFFRSRKNQIKKVSLPSDSKETYSQTACLVTQDVSENEIFLLGQDKIVMTANSKEVAQNKPLISMEERLKNRNESENIFIDAVDNFKKSMDILVYSVNDSKEMFNIPNIQKTFSKTPSGYIITRHSDGMIRLWNIATNDNKPDCMAEIKHEKDVHRIFPISDNQFFVVDHILSGKDLTFFELKERKMLAQNVSVPWSGLIDGIISLDDGKKYGVYTTNNIFYLMDSHNHTVINEKSLNKTDNSVLITSFNQNQFVTANQQRMTLWQIDEKNSVAEVCNVEITEESIAFIKAVANQYIITGHFNGKIVIWKPSISEKKFHCVDVIKISNPSQAIHTFDIAVDGSIAYLASGGISQVGIISIPAIKAESNPRQSF